MVNKRCMIIGAAEVSDKKILDGFDVAEHFVICADGGVDNAEKLGIKPDLVVGDFDSASKIPTDVKVIELPIEKDVTDTMFAAMKGIGLGYNNFVLIGCIGGDRLDHTIANFEVLHYLLTYSARAVMVSEHETITLMKVGSMRITDSAHCLLSVFPYNGSSCTLSYKGMKYPLSHKKLTVGGNVMGVSNQVLEDSAEITVHDGEALIIMGREPQIIAKKL